MSEGVQTSIASTNSDGTVTVSVSMTYDADNRLLTYNGQTVEYDESSNCTELAPYYPSNGGAISGTESVIYLMPGDKIDRFGKLEGKYFSPIGTPVEMRALPYNEDLSCYEQFEVIKPFEVKVSTIAPAFNKIGFGIQYQFPVSADILLKRGIIKRIGNNL